MWTTTAPRTCSSARRTWRRSAGPCSKPRRSGCRSSRRRSAAWPSRCSGARNALRFDFGDAAGLADHHRAASPTRRPAAAGWGPVCRAAFDPPEPDEMLDRYAAAIRSAGLGCPPVPGTSPGSPDRRCLSVGLRRRLHATCTGIHAEDCPGPKAPRPRPGGFRPARDWWRGETDASYFDLCDLPRLNAVLAAYEVAPLSADPGQAIEVFRGDSVCTRHTGNETAAETIVPAGPYGRADRGLRDPAGPRIARGGGGERLGRIRSGTGTAGPAGIRTSGGPPGRVSARAHAETAGRIPRLAGQPLRPKTTSACPRRPHSGSC